MVEILTFPAAHYGLWSGSCMIFHDQGGRGLYCRMSLTLLDMSNYMLQFVAYKQMKTGKLSASTVSRRKAWACGRRTAMSWVYCRKCDRIRRVVRFVAAKGHPLAHSSACMLHSSSPPAYHGDNFLSHTFVNSLCNSPRSVRAQSAASPAGQRTLSTKSDYISRWHLARMESLD